MGVPYVILRRERERRMEINRRIFRDRQNPLDYMEDTVLLKKYRMSREVIFLLCNRLEGRLKRPTKRSQSLPVSLQISVALRYFATGSFQSVNGDVHGISRYSVSRAIHSVSSAMCEIMLAEEIVFPMVVIQQRKIKEKFYQIASFPNVLGTVDGTLVPVIAPTQDEHLYFSHKGYHALNIQGVIGPDLEFLNIVARWPGATHDSLVWRNCSLSNMFQEEDITGGWLLGDSGYPLKKWLMTPVLNPNTRPQHAYNRAHRKSRCVCERCFGVWKARWRCLHKSGGCLMFKPERCIKVIVATAILHNICIKNSIPLYEDLLDNAIQEEEEEYEEHEDEDGELAGDAIAFRNQIIQHHFSL